METRIPDRPVTDWSVLKGGVSDGEKGKRGTGQISRIGIKCGKHGSTDRCGLYVACPLRLLFTFPSYPKLFTREAVQAVKRLGSVQGLRDKDISSMRIQSASDHSVVTAKSVVAADTLIGAQRQSHGTAAEKIIDFFEKDYFRFVDATRKITAKARALIWKTPGLFPKDAVHLASAIEFAASEELDCIHSYDFFEIPNRPPILYQCRGGDSNP